ncbi:SAM hydrolase/SAM-dependent halogenase family protein [Halosolutus halophilus]|uniref:SAM hydrolase/SAM-dependent halogenase family protein n=1 Tax=Halosolutus halophilus TaxID=1552990 RepID=UPI002234EED7|nr:SAM-dependent chlorinase/fluorinase [Halosolutus halophilus]
MLTLASDFGSPYPAAMKGVVCRRTDARLVDVAHDLPRQDVRAAAFWLRETLPYFPPATHLVVVDPGVGTDRNALVVRAGEHALVGPDNGVLCPPARRLAGDGPIETYVIDETRLDPVEPATPQASDADTLAPDTAGKRGPASNTFHGRDVFAPAAAAVHDAPLSDLSDLAFLTPAEFAVDLELPTASVENERARGDVLVVDDFGNAITNVPGGYLDGRETIVANGESVPVGETFAAVPAGDRLATVGSHGYVELDVNQGRGDEAFGLTAGDDVVLEPTDTSA